MAEIEIIYRDGYCECMGKDYHTQCYTDCASDSGCEVFEGDKPRYEFVDGHRIYTIPLGCCHHAKFKYIYKGMSVKNYELEEDEDVMNPDLSCMMLKTRNMVYPCVKVTLNGKVIYNIYDSQKESEE